MISKTSKPGNQRKGLYFLVLLTVLLFQKIGYSQCSTSFVTSQDCSYDPINTFTMNGVASVGNNNTEGSCNSNGYYSFSTPVRTLTIGSTITWSATVGNGVYYDGIGIWIDLNNNNSYELTEFVSSSTPNTTTPSGSFVMPTGVTGTQLRMRVRCAYLSAPTSSQACTNGIGGGYGETEDYFVILAAGCTPPTPSISVVENSGTANDATICANSTATLTASGGTSYAWSTGATTAAISPNPASTTTYTVTVTNANGCTATANQTLTTVAAPTASISVAESSGNINNDGTICNGASATLTASGGTSYAWSTGATTASINQSPSSTLTYTVTVTNASGCTATANQTLTVNALPTATIGITETSGLVNNDGTICSGGAITLTASSATANGYIWSVGGNTASTQQNPTQTTTYTVYFYDSNNCENYQDVTITVYSLPTTTISVVESSGLTNNDGTICNGDMAYLTAAGGTSYTWSTSATTSSINVNPSSTATFSVVATDANGCTDSETTTISVTALPTPNTQNIVLCYGETFTVGSNTYSTSGTYTDTFLGINGCDSVVTTNLTIKPFVSSSQSLVLCAGESYAIGTSTYTTSGTYTDVLTAMDGCDSTVYTDLTILPANVFSQNITLCNGDTYTIGDSVYTISGTYTNVLTAQNGCDSTVTTNLTILNPNTTSQNIVLCFGDSYTIGDSTYTMAGVYTNVLTSSMGCDSTVTTTITVNAPVNVATTVSEITITTTASNATYQWINCATNQAIAGATNQSYTATANGNYAVIVTLNNCSDTSACVTIDNVGLEENEWIVNLYPNPATEDINIETTENMEFIRIFDFSGKLVAEKEVKANATSFSLGNFIKGIYSLQVNTSNASKIIRFVKE